VSEELEPVWDLFRRHGSLRVLSAAAAALGLVASANLPRPLRGLDTAARRDVEATLHELGIRE